jgi:glycerol-3-phosphate dehydrogenase
MLWDKLGTKLGDKVLRNINASGEKLCNHISFMNRQASLDRVKARDKSWDLIVIGGGATGVGCAVDAASRGFDVLLLEQSDFGKGTSSRSTKLIHGGVRYLAQGNISLVREALKERGILLKNAPHLVTKAAFVVPCYSIWQKLYYGAGLKIYDLLAGKYSLGKSRILSREKTLDSLPNITADGLRSGILYFDGQFDDTRLLIDLAITADQHGACLLNYAKVTALIKDENGRIIGADFVDAETSETISVNAKAVVNAAGPFCDEVRKMTGSNQEKIIELSQGTHLVFDRKFLPGNAALMIPKTADGRVLFAIPWHRHLLVGTTDTPVERPTLEPRALDQGIDFILRTVGKYLCEKPSSSDILSVFTGIRPLVKSTKSKNTAQLSRGHIIEIDPSGLVTITGGKWTTYRRMAEDAVNQATSIAKLRTSECQTQDLKIHQSNESNIAELGQQERLHADLPYAKADVVRAVQNEMAVTVEDILARRTRALFLNARAAIDMAPTVAETMANELGKDKKWMETEIGKFNATAQNYSLD